MRVLDLINHLAYFANDAEVVVNCDCCTHIHTKIYDNVSSWERPRKGLNWVIVTVGRGANDLEDDSERGDDLKLSAVEDQH